jgi:hypothetical protein
MEVLEKRGYSVGEIAFEFLTTNGYDGLCNSDCECACKLDDFVPCDQIGGECEAGYLMREDVRAEWCPDCDFGITTDIDYSNTKGEDNE